MGQVVTAAEKQTMEQVPAKTRQPDQNNYSQLFGFIYRRLGLVNSWREANRKNVSSDAEFDHGDHVGFNSSFVTCFAPSIPRPS